MTSERAPAAPPVQPPHPKHLPLAPRSPPETVPARMINEALYCERLMYLEWAQGEFADNYFTVDGRYAHRRADEPTGALPAANEARDAPFTVRSLWLSSERLGITAKIDVIEGEGASAIPVEYKRGEAPDVVEGAFLPERAQLCAQALLLREHGFSCDSGDIYFAKSRRRVSIAIDERLVATTLATVARARTIVARGQPPPPLVDDPRCDGCSLVGICLPDETNLLAHTDHSATVLPVGATAEDAESHPPPIRRLHPALDERRPVYVQEQGARIGVAGERLVIRGKDGETSARLIETSHVAVFGNVQVSTQAVRALLERNVPLLYFSYGGWYLGRLTGTDSKNVELRMAQHRAAQDPAVCLSLARGFVATKLRNCRTLLRRNHVAADPVVLGHLEQMAKLAEKAERLESLLGIEGTGARDYFGQFTGMLRKGHAFELDGRNRRPPRDPVNALLSFAYTLLSKELVLAVTVAGLDPLLGFYHQPRFGRPALALDLMEELRPIVADSVVLNVINTGVVTEDDFVVSIAGAALKPPARKRVLLAFERRMAQEIVHPVFGYRISYRRTLEVQARLLGRMLLGEIHAYPSFRTR